LRQADPPVGLSRGIHRRGLIGLAALIAPLATVPLIPGMVGQLPTAALFLSYSFGRMAAAYGLSLAFALGYGYLAATRRSYERVLLPILDILQSIPILGFFPAAVIFFVALTGPGSFLGPNLASVFLIFTSMSWNMAFGVYESLRGIPPDLKEASEAFGLRGPSRLRRLFLPATVNRLVYNSILSWTAGWFFLVAAEIISTKVTLPGIGSYLYSAAQADNAPELLAGLLVLGALIVAMDLLLWRNLSSWAERFRYDQAPSGDAGPAVTPLVPGASGRVTRAAGWMARGFVSGVSRVRAPFVSLGSVTVGRLRRGAERRPSTLSKKALHYGLLGTVLVLGWLALIAISVELFRLFTGPITPAVGGDLRLLPLAALLSLSRVVGAYLLCLGITLPLAIGFARSRSATRYGLPLVQIIASFPATALFPLFLVVLLAPLGGEAVAILFLITGMIWYLFFNLYSGLRSLPPDLEEAGRSLGLKGRTYYRRFVLPGIFSAFVTGSITAFGGGWNTLILAEYLGVGGGTSHLQLLGLGEFIDIGWAQQPQGLVLMAGALLTMVAVVITLNELLWKPLYRRASGRYRYD
jgi:NitT/TauT family transport system permease protein